jgi:hypothetical protein
MMERHFEFRFAGAVGAAARVVVGHRHPAGVVLTDTTFTVRFGPWLLHTPIDNIAGASVSGPYRWWRVIGPARLSFADRGLTFATNDERGVCVQFVQPVAGMEFTGTLRHPGLTVTVADVHGLVAALAQVLPDEPSATDGS